MTPSRPSPQFWIVSVYSCCSRVNVVSLKSEDMPMIPFMGVRIS